ncbi:Protein of unknown function DUF3537 [Cynara cardunculus var. scolymus]|uniref:Uncharacterized protein n=1 Tax=Cynara cardunculus var. scolymus TaxID=59895 RepID=A0A103XRU0_CYNCS|nr:Protein of unknown function DUF3537 [Cynara cardunculus var. scolymus]
MSDHSPTPIEHESKEEPTQIKTPLILHDSDQTQNLNEANQDDNEEEEEEGRTHLDKSLQRLNFYLCLLGFDQSSVIRCVISWVMFLVIGVAIPVVVLLLTTNCLSCDLYQINGFELVIVASHACLAAVALLCLSHNLRKYGIRKFLFVDQYSGHVERFSKEYIQKISVSKYPIPVLISVPFPGIYTLASIVGSAMYDLEDCTGNHQCYVHAPSIVVEVFQCPCSSDVIIHFDDYGKLLETETDVLVFIEEHARLRHDLSKISHRFRIYLILVFTVVTSSQFAMLFQITEFSDKVTFINGGDFAVSSIAQVVGLILCLNAAAKISHRAQGIAALATRWHALASCGPDDMSHMRLSNRAMSTVSSESDLEAMNYIPLPTNTQLASYLSSYHRRQAFVMYLQNNPGGITLYGWTVDRGLINTIFFIELSLVLFVLGRTTVFTSESLP